MWAKETSGRVNHCSERARVEVGCPRAGTGPRLLLLLRMRQATVARPPQSFRGGPPEPAEQASWDWWPLTAALSRASLKFPLWKWRSTTNSSGEMIALFMVMCQSAYSAFHFQRLPHPSHVILPTPTGRKERGSHPLHGKIKVLMPTADILGGSVGSPRPPEYMSQSVMRNWGLGIGNGWPGTEILGSQWWFLQPWTPVYDTFSHEMLLPHPHSRLSPPQENVGVGVK